MSSSRRLREEGTRCGRRREEDRAGICYAFREAARLQKPTLSRLYKSVLRREGREMELVVCGRDAGGWTNFPRLGTRHGESISTKLSSTSSEGKRC